MKEIQRKKEIQRRRSCSVLKATLSLSLVGVSLNGNQCIYLKLKQPRQTMYLSKTKPTKKLKFIYLILNQSMLGSFNSTNKYNDIKRIVYLPLPNRIDRQLH